jgi:hypothetical protein
MKVDVMASTVRVCASMLTGDKDTISGFQMFWIKVTDFQKNWYEHYASVTQLNAYFPIDYNQ